MYSRFHNRPDEEIHIPEHYSGCAFSQPSPGPEKKREEPIKPRSHPPEATRPSPPPPKKTPPPALLLPPREHVEESEPPPTLPLQGLFGDLGKSFPFSHGIGFDELLLLGLVLLLAQSGKDGDMILWLALLLFCG
jgi:hypothetical protein